MKTVKTVWIVILGTILAILVVFITYQWVRLDRLTMELQSRADSTEQKPEEKPLATEKSVAASKGTKTASAPEKRPVKVVNSPTAEPGPRSEKVTYDSFCAKLDEVKKLGLSSYTSPKTGELVKQIRALGPEALVDITTLLINGQDATHRFAAAAILEKLADPAAIPSLGKALADDEAVLVRRMSSHAIAQIGDQAGIVFLETGLNDSDVGVRINSAYGLAKIKAPGGLEACEQLYNSRDTDAFMKTAVLGIFTVLKDPDAVPFLDRAHSQAKDLRSKLIIVSALEQTPGEESLNLIAKIMNSETEPSVVDAAKKVYQKKTTVTQ